MLAPAMLGVQYVLSIEGRLPLLVTTHSSLLLVRRRLCSCLYYIFARQAFDKTISFTIFFAYFSGHLSRRHPPPSHEHCENSGGGTLAAALYGHAKLSPLRHGKTGPGGGATPCAFGRVQVQGLG